MGEDDGFFLLLWNTIIRPERVNPGRELAQPWCKSSPRGDQTRRAAHIQYLMSGLPVCLPVPILQLGMVRHSARVTYHKLKQIIFVNHLGIMGL